MPGFFSAKVENYESERQKMAFFGVKIDETPKIRKVNTHLFFGEMNFLH